MRMSAHSMYNLQYMDTTDLQSDGNFISKGTK